MRALTFTAVGAVLIGLLCWQTLGQQQPQRRKRVLAIGEVKGFQHDSVSHALASIERWGKDENAWDTYIRTDTQLITKKKLDNNAKNLDYFDAVLFFTTGELPLDAQQKADLMSFVKEEGKGFIAVHSAADTFYQWPEYGEMVGGYFDGHPWGTFDAPIVVEDRDHPASKHLPQFLTLKDEIYQFKNYSRDKVRVLMRLDESKVNLQQKGVNRMDQDFAVTWVKDHGKGRVFYSTLGHTDEAYDNPQVRRMYIEGIRWALRTTEGHTTSHAKPAAPK